MTRGRPEGFLLLAGLGVLSLCGALFVWVALLGGVLSDKQRAAHLADTAALSAAGWFAQSLNYQAYANRAIAANEIMIAQSMTLLAWVDYASRLAGNSATVASVVPALQPLMGYVQEAATLSREVTRGAVSLEVPFRSGYTRALLASQEAMQVAVSPFATQSLVNEVVWSGDRRYFGQYLPSSDVTRFYRAVETKQHTQREPLADFVSSGLDSWSRSRGYDQRLYLLPTTGCIPTSIDKAFSRFVKRGGTALTSDLSSWQSNDTLAIHRWAKRSWWRPTCSSINESISVAWGASDSRGPYDRGLEDRSGYSANPGTFSRANSDRIRIAGYLGFSSFRDFNPTQSADGRFGFRIPILVRLNADQSESLRLQKSEKDIDPSLVTSGNAIWALSVAEVRQREIPERKVVSQARQHLFDPFWSVSLVGSSPFDEAAAALVSGLANK
ncbi:MAG: hypothetical protein EBQ76_03940 [Betaproteobacteria bacterium]|nr:hypothetical protein [Betaproteobacteria bacterium]